MAGSTGEGTHVSAARDAAQAKIDKARRALAQLKNDTSPKNVEETAVATLRLREGLHEMVIAIEAERAEFMQELLELTTAYTQADARAL